MDSKKYIGMDVHQATISVAVRDAAGKLVMESIVETKAATILQFIQGIHGSLWVTFEEGTSAAWLYDLNPLISPAPLTVAIRSSDAHDRRRKPRSADSSPESGRQFSRRN